MTNTIKHHLGTIIASIVAIAAELLNCETTLAQAPTPASGDAEPQPTKPRRGRSPVNPTPPAEETKAPAEPTPAAGSGKTYEELRELIKPLVEEGRGEEVKKVISKYAGSLKEIEAKDHAAFEKDITALAY